MNDSARLKHLYFRDISDKKQLSRKDERDYFKKIDQLKKKIDQLKESKAPNKTIIQKINKLQKDLDFYRVKIIESQYFLIIKIAKNYRNRYFTLFDMIEEGNLALVELIDKFDYKKGYRFSTLVYPSVKNAILKSILNRGSMIREPAKSYYGSHSVTSKIYRDISGQKKVKPFVRTNLHIGMDSSRWLQVVNRYQVVSLEVPVHGTDKYLRDVLPATEEANPVEEDAIEKNLENNLHDLVKALDKKSATIISYYYGLNDNEQMNFTKIAKLMSLSSERVRQIHNKAIIKLRKKLLEEKYFQN